MNTPKESLDVNGKKLPVETCLTCGYEFDCATSVDGENAAGPGDVTLYFKCGEVFQFDESMRIKPVEISALLDLSPEQSHLLEKAQRLIRQNR